MQGEPIKAAAAMLWVFAVCTNATAGSVNTLSGWTTLTTLAILPPLVMLKWWNDPLIRLSPRLQEARR